MARLFSPRADQWGERAISAAFVADASLLLSRTGHLRAAADGYKLSLLLAPSDWPPASRLMAALATAVREAWEERQQSPAAIHSQPENNSSDEVFDDALKLLRAASVRRPEDPTLRFQVGKCAYLTTLTPLPYQGWLLFYVDLVQCLEIDGIFIWITSHLSLFLFDVL